MSGEHNEPRYTEEAECVFNELDESFSDEEISEQIHNLKKRTRLLALMAYLTKCL